MLIVLMFVRIGAISSWPHGRISVYMVSGRLDLLLVCVVALLLVVQLCQVS